jgi:hypothetical protein
MPTIIRQLPFSDKRTSLSVPGGTVSVKPFQIVLSVSLSLPSEGELHPRTPRLPAVLDTGCNGTFVLSEQQLNRWAGLRREHLRRVDEMTVYGNKVPVFAAALWLHPNVAGRREDSASGRPFRVQLDPGIALCPPGVTAPRLPLLGLKALHLGDLQMAFHWRTLRFSLRTTPWWYSWLFG